MQVNEFKDYLHQEFYSLIVDFQDIQGFKDDIFKVVSSIAYLSLSEQKGDFQAHQIASLEKIYCFLSSMQEAVNQRP